MTLLSPILGSFVDLRASIGEMPLQLFILHSAEEHGQALDSLPETRPVSAEWTKERGTFRAR